MYGWMGKILNVNLDTSGITTSATGPYAEKYLGGRGIASRLYWENVRPEISAFDSRNILVFMTDHQRADTLSPWNRAVAPNLAQFARQGVTFTNMYCPSPHCCPSRATFFTGLYPSGHGVWNNVCNDQALSRGLKPGVRLWSEDLAQAGYELHFSGKWHVSVEEGPAQRGWVADCVTSDKNEHHGRSWDQYRQMAVQPEVA